MQWVILIGDETFDINSIHNINHNGSRIKSEIESNRFVVDYGIEHVFYDYDLNLKNDYEIEDLQRIPFMNPHFILMTYTSVTLRNEILSQKNFIKGIYVDDDNGRILPIEEFIIQNQRNS